ncbi:MAG: hypothetical protein JOZ19_07555 [Rubrobacter sp.]|nr:hypothetical protein [Rubrobacter sp.]
MALLRTVLVLIIFVILAHMGLAYSGINEDLNGLTRSIYSLGKLLEIPIQVILDALPTSAEQRRSIEQGGLYSTGLAAVVIYFILFLLLGIGRR